MNASLLGDAQTLMSNFIRPIAGILASKPHEVDCRFAKFSKPTEFSALWSVEQTAEDEDRFGCLVRFKKQKSIEVPCTGRFGDPMTVTFLDRLWIVNPSMSTTNDVVSLVLKELES